MEKPPWPMTYKIALPLLCILLVGGIFLVVWNTKYSPNISLESASTNVAVSKDSTRTHPLVFFEKESFYEGVYQCGNKNISFVDQISGAIVPHHLFASCIIADFFNRLAKQKPKTVILIGPNHYEKGNYQVLSSLFGWETPFGVVEPNVSLLQELMGKNLLKIDETIVAQDHAVAGLMSFVKYYLPNTTVVPLLIKSTLTNENIQLLSRGLSDYITKDTIIIASIDFSHFLTSLQAQKKDTITLELMKNFDYTKIRSLGNDYVDSPPSVITLLMTMRFIGTTHMDILYHTNSGELQKNTSIETTSYFSISYH